MSLAITRPVIKVAAEPHVVIQSAVYRFSDVATRPEDAKQQRYGSYGNYARSDEDFAKAHGRYLPAASVVEESIR